MADTDKSVRCTKVPCKCSSQVLSAAARLPPVVVATPTHGRDAVETHHAE